MPSSIVLFVLLLVGFTVLAALKGKVGGIGAGDTGAGGLPYRPAKALFTPAERSFLGVLDQAVGPQHWVFGKVRVADVAAVERGLRGGARQADFNRISAKHFDFLVCRSSALVPVCAVGLIDSSHANHKAQARDALKVDVCQAIGLPLLVVPTRQPYSMQELRERFRAVALVAFRNEKSTEGLHSACFCNAFSYAHLRRATQ